MSTSRKQLVAALEAARRYLDPHESWRSEALRSTAIEAVRAALKGHVRCTCDASAANRAIGNHFGDCPLR